MVEVVEDLIVPDSEHGQQAFKRLKAIFPYGIFPSSQPGFSFCPAATAIPGPKCLL
jgi:hypothetical protein